MFEPGLFIEDIEGCAALQSHMPLEHSMNVFLFAFMPRPDIDRAASDSHRPFLKDVWVQRVEP